MERSSSQQRGERTDEGPEQQEVPWRCPECQDHDDYGPSAAGSNDATPTLDGERGPVDVRVNGPPDDRPLTARLAEIGLTAMSEDTTPSKTQKEVRVSRPGRNGFKVLSKPEYQYFNPNWRPNKHTWWRNLPNRSPD